MHHRLYSDGRHHGPDIDLKAHLGPLFEKYGVNVVFSGHDHVYVRLKPVELRYRDLKASPEMAAGFGADRSFMVGGDRRRQAVFQDSFANRTGGGFRRDGPTSRLRGAVDNAVNLAR